MYPVRGCSFDSTMLCLSSVKLRATFVVTEVVVFAQKHDFLNIFTDRLVSFLHDFLNAVIAGTVSPFGVTSLYPNESMNIATLSLAHGSSIPFFRNTLLTMF